MGNNLARKMKMNELVKWCPFCGQNINGGSHPDKCDLCEREQVKAEATFCPICRAVVGKGEEHEC